MDRNRMLVLAKGKPENLKRSSGKKFSALVAKLRKNKKVRDPEALAAWIGMRAAASKGGDEKK